MRMLGLQGSSGSRKILLATRRVCALAGLMSDRPQAWIVKFKTESKSSAHSIRQHTHRDLANRRKSEDHADRQCRPGQRPLRADLPKMRRHCPLILMATIRE